MTFTLEYKTESYLWLAALLLKIVVLLEDHVSQSTSTEKQNAKCCCEMLFVA